MRYCGPRGIAHSVFAGWDEHSRDAALSWQAWYESTCQGCGTRREEWAEDDHAYAADMTYCRGCEIRAGAEEQLANAPKHAYPRGTTVTLKPTPREVSDVRHDSPGVDQS